MANDKEEQAKAGYDAGRNGGDYVSRFFGIETTDTYWKNYDQGFEDRISYGKQERPPFLDSVASEQPERHSESDGSSATSAPESSIQSYCSPSSTGHSSPAASSIGGRFLGIAIIALLFAIFGGTLRDNSIERSNGLAFSPISEAELPTSMSPTAKVALIAWLGKNPHFRPANESDCKCADELVYIRKSYANQAPYYAVGDFNRDGLTDFAVVVIDRSFSGAAAPPHNFNSSVLIFSSTAVSAPLKPFLLGATGVPSSSLLFLDRENGALAVGKWEGEVSPIAYSAGRYAYQ